MLTTLITDGFADDEWCDADDVALMRLAIHSMVSKAVRQLPAHAPSEPIPAAVPRPKALTRTQIESLPLWKTRLKVVLDHSKARETYIESYEGPLGNISSHGSSEFRICIGGEGRSGSGRWINMLPERTNLNYTVSVFEVIR